MAIESYYGIEGITIESIETVSDLFEALDAIHSLALDDWEEKGQPKKHLVNTESFKVFNEAMNVIQMREDDDA